MDAYGILVIVLSVLLAVFLVISIVALFMVIKLLQVVRGAADSAKQTAANVSAITGSIKSVADGSLVGAMASKAWDKFASGKKTNKGDKHEK